MARSRGRASAPQKGPPAARIDPLPSPSVSMGLVQVRGGLLRRKADGALFERSRTKGGEVLRNLTADPMAWYANRGIIDGRQWLGGQMLAEAFRKAVRGPIVTLATDRTIVDSGGGGSGMPGVNLERMDAYAKAIEQVQPAAREIVRRVVCWGEWANAAAQASGARPRSGIERLRDGLDDLAVFYRLTG